jgi:hypothetical protein
MPLGDILSPTAKMVVERMWIHQGRRAHANSIVHLIEIHPAPSATAPIPSCWSFVDTGGRGLLLEFASGKL